MDKVLFSKFSYERSEEFRVRTDILERKDGKRYVKKYAGSAESVKHLEHIVRACSSLKKQYQLNDRIEINNCEKKEDGLELEYIQGDTFENLLDKYYDCDQENLLIDAVKRYAEILRAQVDTIPFVVTDEFRKVFGEEIFDRPLESFCVSNIDMIFSNIIVNEKWNIVDYEWTFEFPIPIDYIFFRAIHYYTVSSRRYRLDAEKLYETLGLDISDVKKYKRMELHFQNYVLGNVVQMYKIHQRLSQGELRQDELYESYMKERAEGQLRIYKDFGEGYSEKNACSVYADPKQVCIDIKLEEGVSRIRIDVAHRPGILCFQNAIDGNGHSLRIEETNGVSWGDKTVLFTNEKPHIHFSISGESTVKIVYAYYCVGEDSVKSLIELIEKYHWLYEEKCRMNANQIEMAEKIEGLNARLSETMRQMIEAQGRAEHFAGAYSEISNSTIWRITYPIRKILDKLKGHR